MTDRTPMLRTPALSSFTAPVGVADDVWFYCLYSARASFVVFLSAQHLVATYLRSSTLPQRTIT